MSTALIIDPIPERGEDLRRILEFLEYEAELIVDPGDWESSFGAGRRVEVVLLAPCSGDDGLLEAFRGIRARNGRLPIIYLRDPAGDSAPGREIDAETMATIALPVRHADLQYALQQAMLHGDEHGDAGGPRSPELFRNLVGSSAGVRKVRRLIEKVGKTDATVLLLGESTTIPSAVTSPSSPSTVAPFLRISSRVSSSATRRAPSPALSAPGADASRWRQGGRCSSTRSATCLCPCR